MCEAITSIIKGCAKLILILINVISLVAGMAMIGVGIFIMIEGSSYIPDVGVSLTPVAVCMIVLGALLLFIGGFGCFGACTGRHGLLNFYLILLLIIIVLEVAVIVYVFINKGKVGDKVEESITTPFENMNADTATDAEIATVTSIQELAECCGTSGPDFWTNAAYNGDVPASCCKDAEDDATLCAKADSYQEGCIGNSEDMVSNIMKISLYVIIVIVVFEIVCGILACCSKGEYQQVA